MAATPELSELRMPALPTRPDQFLEHVATHPQTPMLELIQPYKDYESKLREVFAQQRDHPATEAPNVVSVFSGHEKYVKIRARDLAAESTQQKEQYIMPLTDKARKPHGSLAIAQSFRDFKANFNIFSESSLADLDWSNVVVAGSAVATSLLSVPEKHAVSKRALRQYYHEQFAPASDVDLFLYGLTEEQAVEKIKQIENDIRDALLVETTTVRTKYAVTIASQYPTRHVQIVLRVYKSVSEIMASFDIDSSCAAYDGNNVYCSPRALAAFMTQINAIDLSRRSPSYENRLSKYAKRGFEIFWPNLDRKRIDPTIFERSFGRTEGLARLLILERLPKSSDRDAYLDQRREERGRPAIDRYRMQRYMISGDIKADWEDEVAEWIDSAEVSSYHTFTVPYGPNFHARKIDRLLYTKDLLLNAEWNKPKDREVHLHRHPAFFGTASEVIEDCCGSCPTPSTVEEEEVAEKEREMYISGGLKFLMENPGRQQIGSFNPLTAEDWTEMAYTSNTFMLCQAIVDGDSEFVRTWLQNEKNDPNSRDWTGRAPLHLAAANSTVEIVQLLIDGGARLIARLVDGRTALHLAAMRGSCDVISALLRKSEANEEEEDKKTDARRAARKAAKAQDNTTFDGKMEDISTPAANTAEDQRSDGDMMEDLDDDEEVDATTENSMVYIRSQANDTTENKALEKGEDDDEPDVYDVNVIAWDTAASPLHLAIVQGHCDAVKCLVSEFGADPLLPIKIFEQGSKTAKAAVLTLVLALQLPMTKAKEMTQTLIELGATVAQADLSPSTAYTYCVANNPSLLDFLEVIDTPGVGRAINHTALSGPSWQMSCFNAFLVAVNAKDAITALALLRAGAKGRISFNTYMNACLMKSERDTSSDSKANREMFDRNQEQPVLTAVACELPSVAKALIESYGVDANVLSVEGQNVLHSDFKRRYTKGKSLLDKVRDKIEELQKWNPQETMPKSPHQLKVDEHYLSTYGEGSYARWSASYQLTDAKKAYKRDLQVYEDQVADCKGAIEKQTAISGMLADMQDLEVYLVEEKSAQTFAQLHPEIPTPEGNGRDQDLYTGPKAEAFAVRFAFKLRDLSAEAETQYVRLFEAAWTNNVETLKDLTVRPWIDSSGDEHPPLQVAVEDTHGISPLIIAFILDYSPLVSVILEIARRQYTPPGVAKQERFRMNEREDEDGDESDDELRIESETVDEDFTIENIGQMSTQVESSTSPLMMLNRTNLPIFMFLPDSESRLTDPSDGTASFASRDIHTLVGKHSDVGSLRFPYRDQMRLPPGLEYPTNLLQWAAYTGNNIDLLLILMLRQEYLDKEVEDHPRLREGQPGYLTITESDLSYFIQANRPELLEELIPRTGAGLPLQELVKKSGVEMKEEPKSYQGLSVHGRKRKDWADAGRETMVLQPIQAQHPPLLVAARVGSLKTVQWFASEAPLRCYKEFAKTHNEEKTMQNLAQAKGGFEALATKFLNARPQMVIHCCLMGKQTAENSVLLKHLVSNMSGNIDARSSDGLTPLHIAFQLYREESVCTLLAAGANQTARDNTGKNMVHHLLERCGADSKKRVEKLPKMLKLINPGLIPSLMMERCSELSGALTPLAYYMENTTWRSDSTPEADAEILRILLQASQGEEVHMVNGKGETPLHVAVRRAKFLYCRVLIEYDASLLYRENSTGRTPYEMAEDEAVIDICSAPPPMPYDQDRPYSGSARQRLPLVQRQASTFMQNKDTDSKSASEKILDLFHETKARLDADGHTARRLVTLNEANEVARRLASKTQSRDSYRNPTNQGNAAESDDESRTHEDEDELFRGSDEVQAWLYGAEMSL